MNGDELYRLYLMKRNQIDMMRIRGYKIGKRENEIYDMDIENFEEYMNNLTNNSFVDKITSIKGIISDVKEVLTSPRGLLSFDYAKEGESEKSCVVVYITRKEVSGRIQKPFTVSLIGILKSIYSNIIVISDRGLTSESRSIVNSIPAVDQGVPRFFWLFRDEELYSNPLKHKLSPLHELLPEREAREFRKRYINPTLISTEDPVVKFYGWKVNGVVKITRDISSINAEVKELVTKRLIVKSIIVKDIVE